MSPEADKGITTNNTLSPTAADPVMDAENAKLAGALFHTLRATQRTRVAATDNPIYRAFVKRARYDESERRFFEKLARWDWEREVER